MATERISTDRRGEILKAVLEELNRLGGQAAPRDLFAQVAQKIKLSDHESSQNASGNVRWQTDVRFHSVNCVRAGWLQKSHGVWTLTDQGKEALRLPAAELIRKAMRQYQAWLKGRAEGRELIDSEASLGDDEPAVRQAVYDEANERASLEIRKHIDDLAPYDFQQLVAELLIAMGYHVTRVAAPGPDGGVDVIAYRDPLGTTTPRIKVQVKHREQKASVTEVRELEGLLRKDGDSGLFVSSAGFTKEAEQEIRSSHRHIEAIDLDRLIDLWTKHYEKVRPKGKELLPLVTVHFLAPINE
ncbi:MAG: hypothetical protein CHACPFDD_03258 [Phycisphaerae bacterium]|nr:hypothetical protein [Phycisphaerae bacterium]